MHSTKGLLLLLIHCWMLRCYIVSNISIKSKYEKLSSNIIKVIQASRLLQMPQIIKVWEIVFKYHQGNQNLRLYLPTSQGNQSMWCCLHPPIIKAYILISNIPKINKIRDLWEKNILHLFFHKGNYNL